MNKVLFVCVLLLLAAGLFFVTYESGSESLDEYQGPVPLGYDEVFFRETGITKPLEVNDG